MDVLEFKNTIWNYTRKINENSNNLMCPVCEQHGLTMLQVRILMELYRYESHRIGSLAEDICVAGANISAMCKKLESMGLLKRVRDQADERVVNVALTEKGNGIVQEMDKLLNERILQNIGDDKEETFDDIIRGLQKLNNLLEKIISAKE